LRKKDFSAKHAPSNPLGETALFALYTKGWVSVKSPFDRELELYLEKQIAESTGERRRRLTEVNRHAETLFLRKVWWPMFGNFDYLHAEWEVPDLWKGVRFLDFAYLRYPLRVGIEIEGFGPHARYADRGKFADDHLRAAALTAEGWIILRFSYDTVNEHPERIRQLLTLLIGRWTGIGEQAPLLDELDKKIVRLALKLQRPITPRQVCEMAGICAQTARRRLKALTEKRVFRPHGGVTRIRSYELCTENERMFQWMYVE
jgi:hypothetical protein